MLVFFAFALIFDLVSKYIISGTMSLHQEKQFIPGFISFYYDVNNGGAWNLFAGFVILLILVTIVFMLVYLWFYFTKRNKSVLYGIASGLLLGGCIGNLYDRVVYGVVRDFIHLQFINFPTFNIADSAICIGIFLLAIYLLFIYPKEAKQEREFLLQQGFNQNESDKIDTSDLDKIQKRKFNLKHSISIRDLILSAKEKKTRNNKDD